MDIIDLSPSLSVDADKVIAIRSSNSKDKSILVFKGGDTMTVTWQEAFVLKSLLKPDRVVISDAVKNEIHSAVKECLDEYFSGKVLYKQMPIQCGPEVEEAPEAEVIQQSGWKQKLGDDVVDFILAGNTIKKAAEQFGMSERTIYRYLKDRKITKY